MFNHHVNTKAEYTGIYTYIFQNILTLFSKVFSLRDIKRNSFQKSSNFTWNITVKVLFFKYFFLNFSFFTHEEFKIILTKYPKKHLMWIVSKRGIVFRGAIATPTSIYASPHSAIPQTILKCYPPILKQPLPFSRGGLWCCIYCQVPQN